MAAAQVKETEKEGERERERERASERERHIDGSWDPDCFIARQVLAPCRYIRPGSRGEEIPSGGPVMFLSWPGGTWIVDLRPGYFSWKASCITLPSSLLWISALSLMSAIFLNISLWTLTLSHPLLRSRSCGIFLLGQNHKYIYKYIYI